MNQLTLVLVIVSTATQALALGPKSSLQQLNDELAKMSDTLAPKDISDFIQGWLNRRSESYLTVVSSEKYSDVRNLVNFDKESTMDYKCSVGTMRDLVVVRKQLERSVSCFKLQETYCPLRKFYLAIIEELAKYCTADMDRLAERDLNLLDKVERETLDVHLGHYEEELLSFVKGKPEDETEDSRRDYLLSHYLGTDPTSSQISASVLSKMADEDAADVQVSLASLLLRKGSSKALAKKKVDMYIRNEYLDVCSYYVNFMQSTMDPLIEFIRFKDHRAEYKDREEFYKALGRFNWCRRLLAEYGKI